MPLLMKKSTRRTIIIGHDLAAAVVAFPVSVLLRLGDAALSMPTPALVQAWGIFVAVAVAVIGMSRLDRLSWRYASIDDGLQIARVSIITNLILLLVLFVLFRAELIPRSVVLINMFVFAALLAGPRLIYRAYRDGRIAALLERGTHWRIPIVIVGAGDHAEAFYRQMLRDPQARYRVTAIIDDDPSRIGTTIRGVRVYGPLDQLPDIVGKLARRGARPERLVLTADYASATRMGDILKMASDLGLRLDRIPAATVVRTHKSAQLEVQPVDVEDLLTRPQTHLDTAQMKRLLAGKRVAITGAGGSIGSELARQIAAFGPALLVLLEQSEYNLYEIDRVLNDEFPAVAREAHMCDVRNADRVDTLFARTQPDVVFHAAALKHVPLLESQPSEAVLTNVLGTRIVADACVRHGARVMVLISTDKASNPVSIMGATKRLAEAYAQALDLEQRAKAGGTRFVTVRFGNVLGSAGSVVPLFQKQLASGGPLTVTDPDMVRYFMTIREAVKLVLFASAREPGEAESAGSIVVLDMGEPVRIIDMARQMIRLARLEPDVDIAIKIIGTRPGERLAEPLFDQREQHLEAGHPGLLLARPQTAALHDLNTAIDDLVAKASAGQQCDCRRALETLVSLRAPAHDA